MGYIYFVGGQVQGSASMGRFVDLTDAPSLTGNGLKFLIVNAAGTGLTTSGTAPADVVFGDLDFSDLHCERCGVQFKEGDALGLVVVGIEDEVVKTRPAHLNCMVKRPQPPGGDKEVSIDG